MTASKAGAVTNNSPTQWHSINWHRIGKNVRRLQVRIVKARQEQKWGKVKVLQRLLTHSFSAKAMAVRRVTENLGSKTPGVDKEVWDSPEKKALAITRLRQLGYKAQPLRRIYIPKTNNQKRGLSIPTMIDRAQQALHLLALDPIAETQADPNSYGFRVERTTADAIDQSFRVLSKNKNPEWVLEGDIRRCFDQISHQWLLANIPMDKVILKKWLKAGYIEKKVFHQTQEGTPQGGIASPVLARLVLNGLEHMLKEKYPTYSSKGKKAKINVVIYADDFIVTSSSKELLEQEIKPMISNFLKERGLELSEEKTKITNVKEGFDFLGQNIRKYKGKLLIKPSKKNIKSFLDKIQQVIKQNYQAKTEIGLWKNTSSLSLKNTRILELNSKTEKEKKNN